MANFNTLPREILDHVFALSEKSDVSKCATISRSFLDSCLWRLYSSLRIDSTNAEKLFQAWNRLSLTREATFVVGNAQQEVYIYDRTRLLQKFLDYRQLVRLDWTGGNNAWDRWLIVEIAGLPSMTWLGVDLTLDRDTLGSHALGILAVPSLRRLRLEMSPGLPIPSSPEKPPPPLESLHLTSISKPKSLPPGLINLEQWTSWISFGTETQMQIKTGSFMLPKLASNDVLTRISLDDPGPRCLGLPENLSSLHALREVWISLASVPDLLSIVSKLPSPLPGTAQFTFQLLSADWKDHKETLNAVARILNERDQDRQRTELHFYAQQHGMVTFLRTLPVSTLPIFLVTLARFAQPSK
ncbi:hypothetical protein DL96DRAFT_1627194, partial [Flagelloscypha sp. PMI_526]